MRRILIAACLALVALAGCTTTQQDAVITGAASGAIDALLAEGRTGVNAAATLSWGPLEDALAPAYTRLAITRQRAARLLRDGRISKVQALQVLQHTDDARAKLDRSRESRSTWRINATYDDMRMADEVMR